MVAEVDTSGTDEYGGVATSGTDESNGVATGDMRLIKNGCWILINKMMSAFDQHYFGMLDFDQKGKKHVLAFDQHIFLMLAFDQQPFLGSWILINKLLICCTLVYNIRFKRNKRFC